LIYAKNLFIDNQQGLFSELIYSNAMNCNMSMRLKQIMVELIAEHQKYFSDTRRPDVHMMTSLLKQHGTTPYIYIKIALRYLAEDEYDKAIFFFDYASSFGGIFYTEGTTENTEFLLEMQLLKITALFLVNKFKNIPQTIPEIAR